MPLTRIVVTGGHSGLGLQSMRSLLRNPPSTLPAPYHIIMYARSTALDSPAQQAVDELNALQLALPDGKGKGGLVEVRKLDLADANQVKQEAQLLNSHLEAEAKGERPFKNLENDGKGQVDVFFLNAAIATDEFKIVKHGGVAYEYSAFVNHYAPLLFLDDLKATILRGNEKTRIVFTGSTLHRFIKDPVAETLDAHYNPSGPGPYAGGKRSKSWIKHYGNTKFLQLLGVHQLIEILRSKDLTKDIEVVYTEPGVIPNTGITRDTGGRLERFFMGYILPYLPLKLISSPQQGGAVLCAAFSQDLSALPKSTKHAPAPGQPAAEKRVTFGYVFPDKPGVAEFGSPDKRGSDAALQKKWWPEGCFA